MTSDNNIQYKPRPLGPHVPNSPAAVARNKCVVDARKALDSLLDKGDDKKKKKKNDDDDDDGNGANAAAEVIRKGESSANAAWSQAEQADALKAAKKYFEEMAYTKVKTSEQNRGIHEYFKFVLARTRIPTKRSLAALTQKLGTLYTQLKDANGEVLNNHCGDDPKNTFNRFTRGALTRKSGRTLEDGRQVCACSSVCESDANGNCIGPPQCNRANLAQSNFATPIL
ncbi:unnamed protein product [Bathycoccus prasinos]